MIVTRPVSAAQAQPELQAEAMPDIFCDVAVIGAGIAGCTAAQSAAEAGASVICVEKFGTYTAHGADIAAVGSKIQRAQGVNIDGALAARLIYQWSQQQANYHLIKTFADRSGEVLDHYIEMAADYGLEVTLNDEMTARPDWDTLEDRFKQFRSAHKFIRKDNSIIKKSKWNAAFFVEMVYRSAVDLGAEFWFNTRAERLIREGNTVKGVLTEGRDGRKRIFARKGVILATGGITDNRDMIERWCPLALRADKIDNFPEGGNMGDGIIMGAQIGAAISKCNPAPVIHPVNFSALGPGINTAWMTVNRDGRRFCCEVAYEPIVTNARMAAPGNVAFAIWDSDYREHILKQEPVKAIQFIDGIEEAVENEVANGTYFKGGTLRELAEIIGVPPEALQNTADRYNRWCDKGFDEDFGVPERFLCPVRKGPFYASKVTAWLLTLAHGLHVNQNSQVCDEFDEPIGGLYAIGNVQGDFFSNSYPVTLPGANHGRSVTFGRLIGRAVAKGRDIDGYGEL